MNKLIPTVLLAGLAVDAVCAFIVMTYVLYPMIVDRMDALAVSLLLL